MSPYGSRSDNGNEFGWIIHTDGSYRTQEVTNMAAITLYGVKYSSKEHLRSLECQRLDRYSWLRTGAINP
jgi:hypothetical protein